MGESQCSLFQADFNRGVRVEARPQHLNADAGTLLLRELFDCSGLSRLLERELLDPRAPERIPHPLQEMLSAPENQEGLERGLLPRRPPAPGKRM